MFSSGIYMGDGNILGQGQFDSQQAQYIALSQQQMNEQLFNQLQGANQHHTQSASHPVAAPINSDDHLLVLLTEE